MPFSFSFLMLAAQQCELNMVVPSNHLSQSFRFKVSLIPKTVQISICSPLNCCPLVVVIGATIMNWLKSFDLEIFFTIRPTCVYSPATVFLIGYGDPRFLIVLVLIVKGL
jgi:hypothetical protein